MSGSKQSRHELTKQLFLEAIESGLSGPGLSEWLRLKCGSDAGLQAGIEDLLRASQHKDPLFDLVDQTEPNGLDLPRGHRIGRYEIETPIGEGGMGVVYRARQMQPIERTVAIKMIKPGMDTREVLRRFQWEQTVLARLEHPNIAAIFDAGQTERGRPYFVMEFVNGQPLTECCDQTRLTIDERLQLFETICSAIRFAHQNGVLHRDLKPGNLLVTTGDGTAVAKVIDFGIAKLLDADAAGMTRLLRVLGTRPYMSPEQSAGDSAKTDTRSDVFSLGVVLHELILGRTPDIDHFYQSQGTTESNAHPVPRPSEIFLALDHQERSRIAHDRRTSVPNLQQFISGDLDWILMKAIAKTPSERYESVESFSHDLSRLAAGLPVQARRQTKFYLVSKFLRRNTVASSVTLAAVLSLLLGLVASLHQVSVTREAHRQSELLRENVVAAQRQTLALVEAADLRLAAKAVDDGDYYEAADILGRQFERDPGSDQVPRSTNLAYQYLHTRLLEAGRPRLQVGQALHAMTLDPQQQKMAMGGDAGVIWLIDLADDSAIQLPSTGQPSISSLALATGSGDLFAAGSDGSIKRFGTANQNGWRTVCNLPSDPIDFCVSQDGRSLFVCDGGPDVVVIEIDSGQVVRRLRRHKSTIYGIAISEDGSRIATASKDQTSVVWHWPSGDIINQTSRSDYRLVDIDLDSSGKTLVDGSVDGEVRLVDVETGTFGITIRVPSAVSSVDLSPDGKTVVAGCRTGMVYRLTREDFERSAKDKEYASTVFRKSRHQAHDSRVADCLCLGPASVFSVGRDGRFVESNFRSSIMQTTDRASKNDRIAVSADGRWIAAHDYKRLELIETATGKLFSLDAELPDSDYAGLNFSPRGDLFLATQDGRMAQLTFEYSVVDDAMDSSDRSISAAIQVFDAPAKADCAEVRFSRSGDRIMIFSRRDSVVFVVSLPQLEVMFQKEVPDSYTADLSPSGRFLASSSRSNLFIDEVDGGRELAASPDHHAETINDLRFSPDERWVYTASNDRRIKRWEYRSPAVPELVGVQPGDMPKFLSISHDGTTLLSSGRGQQVWLWHLGARQKLFSVMPSPDGFYRTYLSADDSTLIGLDRQAQVQWVRFRHPKDF